VVISSLVDDPSFSCIFLRSSELGVGCWRWMRPAPAVRASVRRAASIQFISSILRKAKGSRLPPPRDLQPQSPKILLGRPRRWSNVRGPPTVWKASSCSSASLPSTSHNNIFFLFNLLFHLFAPVSSHSKYRKHGFVQEHCLCRPRLHRCRGGGRPSQAPPRS
jgi:hypothetical protein